MHVLTGAPGTGKSAVLAALGDDIVTVAEPAREVIAEQRSSGGNAVWDKDPAAFVALLLERSIDKYRQHERTARVMFDRGVPDCVVYAAQANLGLERYRRAALRYRYAEPIIVLPPWEQIYTTDDERRMTFDMVQAWHEGLVAAYRAAGYRLVELPRDTVEKRVELIRAILDDSW